MHVCVCSYVDICMCYIYVWYMCMSEWAAFFISYMCTCTWIEHVISKHECVHSTM